MSVPSPPHFSDVPRHGEARVVIAKWRRQIWLSASVALLGRVGTGAGAGAGGFIVYRFFMPGPLLLPVALLVAAACASGIVFVVRARPTSRAVAALADERFALRDLLGTALHLPGHRADPWHGLIVAQADAALARLSHQRLSPPPALWRTIAGLATGWGAVLVLAAIVRTAAPAPPGTAENQQTLAASAMDRQAASAGRSATQARNTFEAETPGGFPPPGQPAAPAAGERAAGRTPRAGDDASGAGQVDATGGSPVPFRPGTALPAPTGDAVLAGGAGASAPGTNAGDQNASGAGVVSAPPGRHAAPAVPTLAQQRTAALAAVRAGTVPDAARDLVRDFFDR